MGHLHFLLDEMGLDKMGRPPLNAGNVIKICNGMMFDFYPGLNLSVKGIA